MPIEWPKHECELILHHNQHKSYYQTVQQSIERDDHGYTDDCWVSPEQRQKSIDSGEHWMIQWYPNTPNGFCLKSGADLDVVLAAARAGDE